MFYRNKQIRKTQLEYLFYTGVRRLSILGLGANLGIDLFIRGREGRYNAFQNIGGGGVLAPATPRSYAYFLLVVNADKCALSTARHLCSALAFSLSLSLLSLSLSLSLSVSLSLSLSLSLSQCYFKNHYWRDSK